MTALLADPVLANPVLANPVLWAVVSVALLYGGVAAALIAVCSKRGQHGICEPRWPPAWMRRRRYSRKHAVHAAGRGRRRGVLAPA